MCAHACLQPCVGSMVECMAGRLPVHMQPRVVRMHNCVGGRRLGRARAAHELLFASSARIDARMHRGMAELAHTGALCVEFVMHCSG